MKCTKENCGKEAEYIINGQSVCKDHSKDIEDTANESKGKTQGEILSGM